MTRRGRAARRGRGHGRGGGHLRGRGARRVSSTAADPRDARARPCSGRRGSASAPPRSRARGPAPIRRRSTSSAAGRHLRLRGNRRAGWRIRSVHRAVRAPLGRDARPRGPLPARRADRQRRHGRGLARDGQPHRRDRRGQAAPSAPRHDPTAGRGSRARSRPRAPSSPGRRPRPRCRGRETRRRGSSWSTWPAAPSPTAPGRRRCPRDVVASAPTSPPPSRRARGGHRPPGRESLEHPPPADGGRGSRLRDRALGGSRARGRDATGDLVGTLRFVPPEVLAGGPPAASSDVWALGAVMYEALTGRRRSIRRRPRRS